MMQIFRSILVSHCGIPRWTMEVTCNSPVTGNIGIFKEPSSVAPIQDAGVVGQLLGSWETL
jgi:hypothetical protein